MQLINQLIFCEKNENVKNFGLALNVNIVIQKISKHNIETKDFIIIIYFFFIK